MEKLLTLFLSIVLLQNSFGQNQLDCNNKQFQDSLITKYLDKGAYKFGYNHPNWQVYCDSILAICPNIARVYQQKALPYIKSGDFAKAFPLEDKAAQLDPKRYLDYKAFLKCLFSKDYEGSIKDFEEAERLNPNNFVMDHSYWFYQGLCYLELKNYVQAEKCLKKDILLQTQGDSTIKAHYNSYLYLGIICLETKRYADAQSNFEETLKQYSQLPDAHFYMAMIHKELGNAKEKRHFLENAREFASKGYRQNEDQEIYSNYPHQITLYEIEEELNAY